MKKFLSLFLCLILLLSAVTLFTACDNDDDRDRDDDDKKKTTTTTKLDIPDGYELYSDGKISFAYPEDWENQGGSLVMFRDPDTTNNINVVYEDKTSVYDSLTADEFEEAMNEVYESMGMSISNVSVATKKTNGLSVRVFSFKTTVASTSAVMRQTQYVTTIDNRTYTVTVTELVSDADLADTVFETLSAAK
ncbi:MAG: hypothetical protein J6V42_03630 [Clostridia bacterium]|nr:hypothetical protein [Clostridia bacterium]